MAAQLIPIAMLLFQAPALPPDASTAPPAQPPAVEAPTPAPVPVAPPPPTLPPAVKITPYGLLVTTIHYNSFPVNNAEAPTLVAPAAQTGPALSFGVRQSRFGVDASLNKVAEVMCAKSVDVKFEMDFFGGYVPTSANNFSFVIPRLRVFNATLAWEGFRVGVGQDWTIFAPNNPDSISHLGVPAFAQAGNLWQRLPQVRVTKDVGPVGLTLGVLMPADGNPIPGQDTVAFTNARLASAADRTRIPSIEGRVGYSTKLMEEVLSAGLSGHFNQEGVRPTTVDLAGASIPSWGVALDLNIPVGKLLAFKGEGFIGANLDGVFSSSNRIAPTTPGALPISAPAKGGFAQVAVKPGKFGLSLGFGIENLGDSPDADHQYAAGTVVNNWELRAGVTYTFFPKVVVGIEYARENTDRFVDAATPTSNSINNHYSLAMNLGF